MWLVAAAIAWPGLLTAALADRLDHAPSAWSVMVYLGASQVCHQHPERSFHTAGKQWPVCGRCSGLYVAAPLGALAAVALRRRVSAHSLRWWLLAASVPTVLTLALEWTAAGVITNAWRAAAAVPLGAAIAYVLVRVTSGRAEAIG